MKFLPTLNSTKAICIAAGMLATAIASNITPILAQSASTAPAIAITAGENSVNPPNLLGKPKPSRNRPAPPVVTTPPPATTPVPAPAPAPTPIPVPPVTSPPSR